MTLKLTQMSYDYW